MSLKIIKKGVLDTIQDIGRIGYQNMGINPNGVMDPFAAQIANILVHNTRKEAVLEMHYPAPEIKFEENTILALSGADFTPKINGTPIRMNQPILLQKSDCLSFGKPIFGARTYMAIHGGFKLEKWLGSYSTNLKLQYGGLHDTALQKGDILYFNKSLPDSMAGILRKNTWFVNYPSEKKSIIKLLKGNEWEQLGQHDQQLIEESSFTLTPRSDRMGILLDGPSIKREVATEMYSSAVNFGTIQLLPNGKLVILMADHQTTGGYPRIGHVIPTELSKLSQCVIGQKIRFTFTSQAEAEKELLTQQAFLKKLEQACSLKWDKIIL